MKKVVIISLALLTLAGCASQQLENQWKGRSVTNLISTFGYPKQIKNDGLSQKVYIYIQPESSQKAHDPNDKSKIIEAKVNMFWINRNGLIDKAKQQSIELKPSEKIDVPTSKRDF
jgi:uncharacterized protein YcfL